VVVGMHGLHPDGGVLAQLVHAEAHDAVQPGADVLHLEAWHPSVAVVQDHVVRHHRPLLGEEPVPLLRLLRLRLRLLASGDVHQESLEEVRLAGRVTREQRRAVVDPHHVAVLVQDPILVVEGRARGLAPHHLGQQPVPVVRVDPADPEVGGGEPLGPREAHELLDHGARVVIGHVIAFRGVPDVEHRGEALHHEAVPLLGLPDLLLGALTLADLERHHLVGLGELGGTSEDAELEFVVGELERLLGLLLRGDVHHHALPRPRLALAVAHQCGEVAHPHHVAVVRDQAIFPRPRLTGLVVEVVRRQLDLPVVGVQQLHPDVGLIEPLLPRVAEDLLDVRAHVEGPALVVGAHLVDDGRDALDEGLVTRLGIASHLLRVSASGDVEDDALPEPRRSGGVDDQPRLVAHPQQATIATDEPVLAMERGPTVDRTDPLSADAIPVEGMDRATPQRRVRPPLLGGVADHVEDLRAHVQRLGPVVVGVDVEDRGDLLDERAVQVLAGLDTTHRIVGLRKLTLHDREGTGGRCGHLGTVGLGRLPDGASVRLPVNEDPHLLEGRRHVPGRRHAGRQGEEVADRELERVPAFDLDPHGPLQDQRDLALLRRPRHRAVRARESRESRLDPVPVHELVHLAPRHLGVGHPFGGRRMSHEDAGMWFRHP
jgi:hypothetical protein